MSQQSKVSTSNLTGIVCLQLEGMEFPCCILTTNLNCEIISELSVMSSMLFLGICMQQLILMLRFRNGMNKALTTSMIATRPSYYFSLKCSRLVLMLALTNVAQGLLPYYLSVMGTPSHLLTANIPDQLPTHHSQLRPSPDFMTDPVLVLVPTPQ